MNAELVKKYVCLEVEKARLEADLKLVKHDLQLLEIRVVDEMINAGFKKVSAEGRTLELVPEIFANPIDGNRDAVIDAFGECPGLEGFLKKNYNDSQLRGFVREQATEAISKAKEEGRIASAEDVRAALPEPLGRVLKVYLGSKLSSRKA